MYFHRTKAIARAKVIGISKSGVSSAGFTTFWALTKGTKNNPIIEYNRYLRIISPKSILFNTPLTIHVEQGKILFYQMQYLECLHLQGKQDENDLLLFLLKNHYHVQLIRVLHVVD